MKKNRFYQMGNCIYIGVFLIIMTIGFITITQIANAEPTETQYEETWQAQKVILLDAGHGGIDGGGVPKLGLLEKDLNLIITKKIKNLLENEGYRILMTREEDKGLYTESGTIRKKKIEDLDNRYKMKTECGCDMFISIHMNMFPQNQYYGAQVWYGSNEESKKLAKIVQEQFMINLDKNNDRKGKPAGNSYKILRANGNIPAIIAECGFLSNMIEAEKLNTEVYQDKIAESITQSINMYFGLN